ncbi:MAG: bifunctional tRNA (5-methylaminomethyl-2-thiouridine)(34)-methyltransferase MnmD/FAD-dependent 5-carboxymethylaminomethyl-2-thiouridine(34) oxidoreductase MnmC [Proteobacteria bacterium]|nr:bifunctional tRNA (5-methylaminomethyl-2-thiouridine)(34)-methyltransferase MnmD/FAD-dependent 5-carboxymethylaminomethyl-2-thiouridine(34) oxidoreductase MnmC [Pseudomonadota bacterium]
MKSNPFPIKQINSLNLTFDESGSAYSENFNDIYFQSGMGLEEKEHVFLKGNQLPRNWQDKDLFCIAETGFGIGINFLSTLQLWNNTRQASQQLHYISCELLPLNIQQLTKALATFPELEKYSLLLIERYTDFLIYGTHRIHFEEFNTTLTLIFGDCVDAFENIDASVDAWFLDGFAPSKNPKMWSDKLFKAISNLSHIGTTVTTYTVAGKIRQGLSDVGFEIKKVKGFGQKREMLTGQLTTQSIKQQKSQQKPLKKQPWSQTFEASKQQSFTVLGAGIAGLSIAQKLLAQGKNVTLIDRQKQPCLEASGNPQAMVMPSFDLNDSNQARFYLSAFMYAIRHYSEKFYHAVGVHQLAFSEKEQDWQKAFLSRFDLPHDLIHQYKNGLLYPQAGWLDTQGHANQVSKIIDNYLHAEVVSIKKIDGLWHLYKRTSNQESVVHTTECLILANGINILQLLPDFELPVTPKHGEVSFFHSSDIDPQIGNNPHVQLYKGYITPSWNGIATIGSTFDYIDRKDWYKPPSINHDHWQRNTALWDNTPYAKMFANSNSYQSRAGIRVTTPDHLPICGAVINQQQFKKDYHDIRHGKHWKQYPLPKPIDNLYIMTGLGSRGFTSAPLLAESLVNQILGQPQVLDPLLQKSIHPNRFLFKSLKRQV